MRIRFVAQYRPGEGRGATARTAAAGQAVVLLDESPAYTSAPRTMVSNVVARHRASSLADRHLQSQISTATAQLRRALSSSRCASRVGHERAPLVFRQLHDVYDDAHGAQCTRSA